MNAPFFSIVMPVLDGGEPFDRCLQAIARSSFEDWELIVVDDGSSDGSAEVAAGRGARVLATSGREGPAAARNQGSQAATGEYLFFIDADCEVGPETLARAARHLEDDPDLAALFGSYDTSPVAKGLVSQFKNLMHHYVHQNADPRASTFWAGCGVVRRETFLRVGGFDAGLFDRPSIEDIELGYRLTAQDLRIFLAKDVQVRHHKRWTLGNLIRTDVFDRGIPWTRLMLGGDSQRRELNLDITGRLSVVLVGLLVGATALSFVSLAWAAVAVASLAGVVVLNRRVYGFFARQRGWVFALAIIPLHVLYYAYSAVAFAVGSAQHFARRRA